MTIIPDATPAGDRAIYGARPVKRPRRTNAEIEAINQAIVRIMTADHPMTLRGLFYRLVSEGAIGKTEAEYKNTGRYLLDLRRAGRVPYAWVADHTRWMRKPPTYRGLEHALTVTTEAYRRSLWAEQPCYVEVWCEKDTLAGVLYEETSPWDVPLMVARGFSSETYVYDAAEAIRRKGKPTYLYLLTDHDPSGLAIARDVDTRLRGFLPDADLTVTRIAVTEAQIQAWSLPTRPTKRTDSRAKTFRGESVELDAIPAATLRGLVRDAITRHIDPDILAATEATERLERETLYGILDTIGGAQ